MEQFSEYSWAILSMALFALIPLVLAPIAATEKDKLGLTAGSTPEADYSSQAYRLWRAHLNASESIGVFVAVTVAAMLAGASPVWVNLLAVLLLAGRLVHVVVHVQGIGAEKRGPRTVAFVFGWAMCALLALLAIFAAL